MNNLEIVQEAAMGMFVSDDCIELSCNGPLKNILVLYPINDERGSITTYGVLHEKLTEHATFADAMDCAADIIRRYQ